MSAFCLPRTEVHELTVPNGRTCRLYLAFPEADPPADGFPVVYLLDANALFGSMVEAIRMRAHRAGATGIPHAVVAGIGYATEGLYDRVARTYDYTPGPAAGESDTGDALLPTGGANEFLSLLELQIMAEVERRAKINPAKQVLFGHSLAGFFVLYALLQRPSLFRTFVASSPSIWWNRELLLNAASESVFAETKPRVVIAVGEYEQRLAPWQREVSAAALIAVRRSRRAMVDNARELTACLSAAGAEVDFQEFAGEDHASVPLLAINRGLRYAFALDSAAAGAGHLLDTLPPDAI